MILPSITLFILTVATLTPLKDGVKHYSVQKITGDLTLSGKGQDPLWKKAKVVSDFQYPWEKETPPATTFKALHNADWLYGLFEVQDDNVFVFEKTNHKSEVASSSRAEIFFRIDDKLNPYYCLEMDPVGRVLDYKATYHRKFDIGWSWPAGHLILKTERRKDGYTVEFAISKASLRQLGILNGKSLEAGLFRGDSFPKSDGEPDFKWISWVKPKSDTPDFHIPSSFGVLTLED